MVDDLLDRILGELPERAREARSAHDEYQQLEQALAALDADPRRSNRPPAATQQPRRRHAASGNGRARRGANREAILAVVRERPGMTAREISHATGIARTTVASTVTRLAASGALERSELPGGGVGFREPKT